MDEFSIDFRICSKEYYDDFITLVRKYYATNLCGNEPNDKFPIHEIQYNGIIVAFAYHTMGGTNYRIQAFDMFPGRPFWEEEKSYIVAKGAPNIPEKRTYSFPTDKEQLDLILKVLFDDFIVERVKLQNEDSSE